MWSWQDNPFVGTRELRGLVVMMADQQLGPQDVEQQDLPGEGPIPRGSTW